MSTTILKELMKRARVPEENVFLLASGYNDTGEEMLQRLMNEQQKIIESRLEEYKTKIVERVIQEIEKYQCVNLTPHIHDPIANAELIGYNACVKQLSEELRKNFLNDE